MLQAFEVLEDLVLELEDVFALILLFHFKRNVHAQVCVKCFIYITECPLAKFLGFDCEAVGHFW